MRCYSTSTPYEIAWQLSLTNRNWEIIVQINFCLNSWSFTRVQKSRIVISMQFHVNICHALNLNYFNNVKSKCQTNKRHLHVWVNIAKKFFVYAIFELHLSSKISTTLNQMYVEHLSSGALQDPLSQFVYHFLWLPFQ